MKKRPTGDDHLSLLRGATNMHSQIKVLKENLIKEAQFAIANSEFIKLAQQSSGFIWFFKMSDVSKEYNIANYSVFKDDQGVDAVIQKTLTDGVYFSVRKTPRYPMVFTIEYIDRDARKIMVEGVIKTTETDGLYQLVEVPAAALE